MKKHNRLILIDGSGYIFRAYHALPPMTKDNGIPVNAVYGFTNMLIKLIEDYGDEKLIVIFDAARENFRNQIYPKYKANRGETPEDLIPQFDLIKKCVDVFEIPQLELEGFEADDIIATYTNLAKKNEISSLIVSSDKDLMQLVNDNVQMLDPMKNKLIGIKEVIEKFGVKPDKVVHAQALIGDRTDNIPGAPGIGPKTAAELIKHYNSIEELIKNYHLIKQENKRRIIKEHKDNIKLSLKLVKLKQDIKLPINLDQIIPYNEKKINYSKIKTFLIAQGFKTVLQRLEKNNYVFNNYNNVKQPEQKKVNYYTISKIEELKKLVNKIIELGFCSIDTETDSLNIDNVKLVGVSLCYDTAKSFYIPIIHKEIISKKFCKNQIPLEKVIEQLSIVCENSTVLKIGQNIKYDIRVLQKYNINFNSIADTMLMSYAFENGIIRHNMDDLAFKHLNHSTIKFKDLVGSGKKKITFDYVNIEKATNYAAEDAYITFQLYKIFLQSLQKEKNNFIYEKIDRPLINVLVSMENTGVKINKKYLTNLSLEFSKQIQILEEKIFKLTKKEFNIGSPKQLGEILFNEMGLQSNKKTKTGTYSTDSNILEELAFNGEKIAKYILDWRELSKLKSTYIDALIEQISPNSKRVHTSYANAITLTGRLSSNDPNLQNIPIRTVNGKKIRNAFIAEKSYKLVSFDYSQIELRLAAEISGDNNLIDAFNKGEDIHSSTASQIFGLKENDVNIEFRRKAKAINFGIIYGISPFGLAKQLSISNTEAKKYIEEYFNRFPKIKEYMDNQIKFCRENQYVKTIFGRKCFIKGINDKNFSIRGFSERQSINAPIQGTAADIIKLAMIEIHKKNINAKMLLQVHDELVFEIADQEVHDAVINIKSIMETNHIFYKDFKVSLIVDYKIGSNWGELN
tara:strand:+ start:1922 stop:4654 length:2733 start_codon:yes stop_codon:yes gene_type:complete